MTLIGSQTKTMACSANIQTIRRCILYFFRLPFQNNPKSLDMSYETALDFEGSFGIENSSLSRIFSSPEPKAPGSLQDKQMSVVVVRHMTSTLSNDISSEATGPFKPKFHLWYPWAGGLNIYVFYENCLLSLVAMAT